MFANDDYQLAEPGSLRLQWLWHNLTMDQSAKVTISLYGYRETTNTPELVFIDTVAVSYRTGGGSEGRGAATGGGGETDTSGTACFYSIGRI